MWTGGLPRSGDVIHVTKAASVNAMHYRDDPHLGRPAVDGAVAVQITTPIDSRHVVAKPAAHRNSCKQGYGVRATVDGRRATGDG
jgi:hypothetical protein